MNLIRLVDLYKKNVKIIWKKRNPVWRVAFHNSDRTITNTIEPRKMKPISCIIQNLLYSKNNWM